MHTPQGFGIYDFYLTGGQIVTLPIEDVEEYLHQGSIDSYRELDIPTKYNADRGIDAHEYFGKDFIVVYDRYDIEHYFKTNQLCAVILKGWIEYAK